MQFIAYLRCKKNTHLFQNKHALIGHFVEPPLDNEDKDHQ